MDVDDDINAEFPNLDEDLLDIPGHSNSDSDDDDDVLVGINVTNVGDGSDNTCSILAIYECRLSRRYFGIKCVAGIIPRRFSYLEHL